MRDEAVSHFELEILVQSLPPRFDCIGLFFVVLLVCVLQLLPVLLLDPVLGVAVLSGRHLVSLHCIYLLRAFAIAP